MIFDILLAILATYRLALMLATEEGAFSIFEWIRSHIDFQQTSWVGRGLNCPLCVGFWLALVFAALITSSWQMFLLTWFAIAGGQVLLQKWTERE